MYDTLTMPLGPEPANAEILDGQFNIGAILSKTVTVCEAVFVLPAASVAIQVTTVFPNGKLDGALLLTLEPEQLSLNRAVPKLKLDAVQLFAFTFTVLFTGAVTVGFCVSIIVTVKLQVEVPVTSVAS